MDICYLGFVKLSFCLLGVIFSFLTAKHMVDVHGAGMFPKEHSRKEIFHDYILNFFGTLLGWISLYYIIFYRISGMGNELKLIDLFLVLVAYVGVTGYLPHLIVNKGLKP